MEGQQWTLPQITPFRLGEQIGGVNGHTERKGQPQPEEYLARNAVVVVDVGADFKQPLEAGNDRKADQQNGAAGQPAFPLRPHKNVEETLRPFQVVNEQPGRGR